MIRLTLPRIIVALALAVQGVSASAQQPAGKQPAPVDVAIDADAAGPVVDRHIFGQFAEHLGTGIYGGVWVGPESPIPNIRGYRTDVIEALRAIRVPVIRWPGGCFADEYHWRDGIGDPARRPVRLNTIWGGVTESNRFGTHEFMEFAQLVGAEAYVSVNLGSAPPSEAAQWLEYMTSPSRSSLAQERRANGREEPWPVRYVGFGNELWGCGGQMSADYAADLTLRYSFFAKTLGGPKGLRIASGPSDEDYAWTETMMRRAAARIDGIALHYYTLPRGDWAVKGPSTGFDEADWLGTFAQTFKMDRLITGHSAVMDRIDPARRVMLAVDEWGAWYDPDPGTPPGFLQQHNTLRDALVAGVNFNIFVSHAERVRLANIAQMANVLQSILRTDGAKLVLTPTYHVHALYLPWQDARRLPVRLDPPLLKSGETSFPALSVSAVRGQDGRRHVAIVNVDPQRSYAVRIAIAGGAGALHDARILTGDRLDARNDFDAPNRVVPQPFKGVRKAGPALLVDAPAHSLVVIALD